MEILPERIFLDLTVLPLRTTIFLQFAFASSLRTTLTFILRDCQIWTVCGVLPESTRDRLSRMSSGRTHHKFSNFLPHDQIFKFPPSRTSNFPPQFPSSSLNPRQPAHPVVSTKRTQHHGAEHRPTETPLFTVQTNQQTAQKSPKTVLHKTTPTRSAHDDQSSTPVVFPQSIRRELLREQ